ncbi:MAG: hypothetical protein J7J70_02225 [Deltaproteobacteria bacterium]|nr:hypothetical protein [Candidatus Tharpellaceae bacterium]
MSKKQEDELVLRQIADRMSGGLYSDACLHYICKNKPMTRMLPLDDEAKKIHDNRYDEKYNRRKSEKV